MTVYTQNTFTYNPLVSFDSTSSFTLQSGLSVSSTVNIYDQAYSGTASNYVVFVNIGDFSTFFANASYEDYLNTVNINLTIDNAQVNSLLNTCIASVFYRGSAGASDLGCGLEKLSYDGTTFTSTKNTLGYRLLELAALQIFNNGKARAAISNDTDYINGTITDSAHDNKALYTSITNQLYNAFVNDKFNIFNQYVNTGRYENSNDYGVYKNFNFTGVNIQVLLTFAGTVNPSPTTSIADHPYGLTNSFSKTVLLILTDSYSFTNVPTHGTGALADATGQN